MKSKRVILDTNIWISFLITKDFSELDNFLLNLAEDSNADYLISGDKDLLDLIQIKQTKIVSWKAFLNEIT